MTTTEQAITAERLRIARELHDMVSHSIGIIAIQAGVGSRVMDTQPLEARNALGVIEVTSRETLSELRRMLGALRQIEPGSESDPAPPDPAPGPADVDALAATTADAGVRIEVQWRGRRRPLPADIDLSAFRIIQEGVPVVLAEKPTDIARWLTAAGVPSVRPYDLGQQPIVASEHPVSFWHAVSGGPTPDTADLARLLVGFHALDDCPCDLPAFDPLAKVMPRLAAAIGVGFCWTGFLDGVVPGRYGG